MEVTRSGQASCEANAHPARRKEQSMDAIALEGGWSARPRPGLRMVGAAVAALTLAAPLAGLGRSSAPTGPMETVIVRAVPGAEASVQRAVEKLGGTVGQHLSIINGFTAKVPGNHVPWLSQEADVAEVTADVKGHLMGETKTPATTTTVT